MSQVLHKYILYKLFINLIDYPFIQNSLADFYFLFFIFCVWIYLESSSHFGYNFLKLFYLNIHKLY
jgi:hypothetical protein